MEQCTTARVASACLRNCYALAGVLLFASAQVFSADSSLDRDYLLPGESHGGFIYTPSNTQSGQAAQKQSTVNYQAFDGTSYQLEPHAGHFVTILLPTTASGSTPFTEDQIEELVDRLDILYATYRDLMQGEPDGSGPLTVAFVPETCRLACAYIGSKGIEIKQDPKNYKNISFDLSAGTLDSTLTHEMAHNFDLYWNYLHYLPDHGHAWTDMFEYFAPYRFARKTHDQQLPDDLYQSSSNSVWKPYLEDNLANWERCVRDQLCHAEGFMENHLWAMIYYRIEALHGVDAITKSFAYLKDYAQTHEPPNSTQEKEDLRLMSLAVGANTNISCYLDTLKWPVSPTLKNDLQARFGNSNTFCNDSDGDGFSVIEGDCDDKNPARSPGKSEIKGNGIDDDCDEILDETTLVESSSTDLPDFSGSLAKRALPFEIRASLSDLEDRDAISFTLPPNGRVEVKLCVQDGFSGWATALQTNGQFLDSDFWYEYMAETGCTKRAFDFSSQASGNLEVLADQRAGSYSLSISAADDMPPDDSRLLKVVPGATGGMNIVFSDPDGTLAEMGAVQLEFWISGQALTVTTPYAAKKTISLNASSAPGLTAGNEYQVRMRPLRNGQPLAEFSAGHLFRYDTSPKTPTRLDGGYSGAWYDPNHSGEGFVVEVNDNNQALVYWFTYTPDGEQRWMLGVGKVQSNSIVINELLKTHGGKFGDHFNPDDVTFETSGSLSIAFLDCHSAIVNYSVDNNGDHQRLERLSSVQGHTCGKPALSLSTDLSGSWYDPAHSGEGYVIQQLSDQQALVYWFSYNSTGDQAWMFNTASIENGSINVEQLLQASGGGFGRSFDPASVKLKNWGQLDIQLDCSGGSANYTSDKTGFSSGEQQLVPLTRLQGSTCGP